MVVEDIQSTGVIRLRGRGFVQKRPRRWRPARHIQGRERNLYALMRYQGELSRYIDEALAVRDIGRI
jgi:hypothetical protein